MGAMRWRGSAGVFGASLRRPRGRSVDAKPSALAVSPTRHSPPNVRSTSDTESRRRQTTDVCAFLTRMVAAGGSVLHGSSQHRSPTRAILVSGRNDCGVDGN